MIMSISSFPYKTTIPFRSVEQIYTTRTSTTTVMEPLIQLKNFRKQSVGGWKIRKGGSGPRDTIQRKLTSSIN